MHTAGRPLGLLIALLLVVSCATTTGHDPASDLNLPRSVDDLIADFGAPPIRFTVDARLAARLLPDGDLLAELPADVRPLIDRVEFLGYYSGPELIARFSVLNGVVVSRTTVTVPELIVAEPGELAKNGSGVEPVVGETSTELVELSGIPDEYQRSEEREVLTYTKHDDYVIAIAEATRVWSVFTLRIAADLEPNYRSDLATTIMSAFIETGSGVDLGRNREHVLHMLRAGR